ncbi:MAG: Uma2 family endonuclease [Nocardioidaceae bacterium]
METVTTLPRGRPLTRADLETMPDDGHRYELIDGTLIVTPASTLAHQRVVVALTVLLTLACPDDLEVLVAPFDVALDNNTVVQPDLLVARRRDLTARDLPTAPVLAVEVLSPSTRRVDTTLKRSRFESAGCPSYWVVDPEDPALRVWELEDGGYVERHHVAGDQDVVLQRPYPLVVNPARLAGRGATPHGV